MRPAQHSRRRTPSLSLCGLSLLLMIVLWVVLVGGTRPNEMIVGAGVVLCSSAFLGLVWRTETLRLEFNLRCVVEGWRVPWYIVTDVYEIITVFLKDLFRLKPSGSYYRASGFESARGDAQLEGRQVLATFYTTLSPNFIVIGIDDRQGRMLFHQLERTSIPKMTRALGAQSGGRRP